MTAISMRCWTADVMLSLRILFSQFRGAKLTVVFFNTSISTSVRPSLLPTLSKPDFTFSGTLRRWSSWFFSDCGGRATGWSHCGRQACLVGWRQAQWCQGRVLFGPPSVGLPCWLSPMKSDKLFFDLIRYRYDMRVFLSIRYDTIWGPQRRPSF